LFTRLLFVAFFLEMGLLLVLVPWSAFWEHNYFLQVQPALRALAMNGFVRGGVSGLGLVNLAAGMAELVSLLAAFRRSS
jgi:hypothetical protein